MLSLGGNAYSFISNRRRGGTALTRSQRGEPLSRTTSQLLSTLAGLQTLGSVGTEKEESWTNPVSGFQKYVVGYSVKRVVIIPNVSNCPSVACLFVCLILRELSPLLLLTVVIYCCFCYATGFFFFFCSAISGVSAVAVWQVLLLLLQPSPPALTALARRLSCDSQWDTQSNTAVVPDSQ